MREPTGFESTIGGGVTANLDGKAVRVGKEKFLTDASVTVPDELKKQARALQDKAQTTVWVAIDGQAVGETPIGNLTVPIGAHDIVLRHPEFGEQHYTQVVTLKAPARLSVDLRKK